MFLINREKNTAETIPEKTFTELDFYEVHNLQEWICQNPDILGERLLIIQKEFSDFADTKERLDLLAIDTNGNLVIIENKLDDSGKDVVWQSLKYTSYCSGMTKDDLRGIFQDFLNEIGEEKSAGTLICEFLESDDFDELALNRGDQRIIMVAANFRKEVTSTVMWLLDHNVQIKCIKVTPYKVGGRYLLDSKQIIPVTEAEEYLIKIANKQQEAIEDKNKMKKRYTVRLAFWDQFLNRMNKQTDLYRNVNPTKENRLDTGSHHQGITYTCVVTGTYAMVSLWIGRNSQEENKRIFDDLYEHEEDIRDAFGDSLHWERLDNGKRSRIAYYLTDVNVFDENDWDKMIEVMITHMMKLEESLKDVLDKVV